MKTFYDAHIYALVRCANTIFYTASISQYARSISHRPHQVDKPETKRTVEWHTNGKTVLSVEFTIRQRMALDKLNSVDVFLL